MTDVDPTAPTELDNSPSAGPERPVSARPPDTEERHLAELLRDLPVGSEPVEPAVESVDEALLDRNPGQPSEAEGHHLVKLLRDVRHGVEQGTDTSPSLRGQALGRFIVLGTLGSGGMGTVLRAYDEKLDRKIAIKVLHAGTSEQHAKRLLREAQALAKLSHPNVVQVYEVGEVGNQVFIAMELVKGETLRSWQERRPPWRECVKVYLQAGAGLAAAHAAGLTHRDFKPDNCIIDESGRVRVLDFGLVRETDDTSQGEASTSSTVENAATAGALTKSGTVLGTPAYMSLEQLEGRSVDARSDQFSFCVSLYEVLYGERPFPGNSIGRLMHAVQTGRVRPAPRMSRIPSDLRRVLRRGLASDPDDRWPSMETLLEQLQRKIAPRKTWWLIAGGLLLVSLAITIDRYRDAARVAMSAEQSARVSLLAGIPGRELEALELGVRVSGALSEEAWLSGNVARSLYDALAASRNVITLRGHTKRAWPVAWTADGTRLVTASEDGTVKLWSGSTGEHLATLEGYLVSFVWTADGSRLAIANPEDEAVTLWNGSTGELLATLHDHREKSAIAWAPDGSRLATSGSDGIWLWHGTTGKLLATFTHSGLVGRIAWTMDGAFLATTGRNEAPKQQIKLWDSTTGKLLATVEGSGGLAWSPDGTSLATASRNGKVMLWSRTGELLTILDGHAQQVGRIVWNAKGTRIATAGEDWSIGLWDAASAKPLAVLKYDYDTDMEARRSQVDWGPPPIAWIANGSRLAAGGWDGTVRLWDGTTGVLLATLDGHTKPVGVLALAPEKSLLATSANDGTVRLWSGITGEALGILGGPAGIKWLAWAPDGSRLATADEKDGTVRLWSDPTGPLLATVESHERSAALAWAPDGTRLATAGQEGTVNLVNGTTGELLTTFRTHGDSVETLAWTADGSRLAILGDEGTVKLWNGSTGEIEAVIKMPIGIYRFTWTPDGTRLATIDLEKGRTTLWSGLTGERLAELSDSGSALAWSSDGTRLAIGTPGGIRFWDEGEGISWRALRGHRGQVSALAWTEDDTRLASAGSDGTAKIWSGRGGTTLEGHADPIVALAWAPDGTRLATASHDRTAKLWNGKTGDLIATLNGHANSVVAVAWAADGTRLATASSDGTAKLWSGATGDLLATLEGHKGSVVAVAWAPDGTRLATIGSDGTTKLWLASPRGWLIEACKILEGSTGTIELHEETQEICAVLQGQSD